MQTGGLAGAKIYQEVDESRADGEANVVLGAAPKER